MRRTKQSIECWVLQHGARHSKVLLLRVAESDGVSAFLQPITGGIYLGESPEEACIREVNEETGLDLEQSHLNRMPQRYQAIISDELVVEKTIFYVWIGALPIRINPDEHSDYEWLEWTNVMERLHWQSNKDTWRLICEVVSATLPLPNDINDTSS